MSDCKYCSQSGNCLRHVGYKWHQRFLSPCVGKDCGQYKKVSEERSRYKWGAKEYLSSFNVGEMREWDGVFPWRSLSCIASKLKKQYGCVFRLATIEATKTKVIMRIA